MTQTRPRRALAATAVALAVATGALGAPAVAGSIAGSTAGSIAGSTAGSTGLAADPCPAVAAEPGYRMLFDGTQASLDEGWTHSGPGSITRNEDCVLVTEGGLGMLWYSAQDFRAYTLRLDWKIDKLVDNAGIFVGFPDGGADTHNTAINKGYEVQIDQVGRSTGETKYITGALYNTQPPNVDTRLEVTRPTDWNTYEITVDAPRITIRLNGVVVNEFTSTAPGRDLTDPTLRGHFGLQAHGTADVTYYRNIQVKEIEPGGDPIPVPVVGGLSKLRNNTGIYQDPTGTADFDGGGAAYSELALQVAGVEPGGAVAADGFTFTWPTTASGANDNVISAGQVLKLDAPRGSTRLGFLASSSNGPSTGTLTLDYVDATGATVTRAVPFGVTDWTLNGGGGTLVPGNVVAATAPARILLAGVPQPIDTYLFAVDVPLDPALALRSVKLPRASSGAIHLFDVAVQ